MPPLKKATARFFYYHLTKKNPFQIFFSTKIDASGFLAEKLKAFPLKRVMCTTTALTTIERKEDFWQLLTMTIMAV